MEITEEKRGEVIILGLKGRLDANTVKGLEDKLLALTEGGENRLVIDLSQLDYIGSAGLRVLLVTAKSSAKASGKLVLASLRDPVRDIFDMSGFSSIFTIHSSLDEAVDGCK